MFCPKCGNQIPEGNSFCGKCGATVESPKPVENQFTEIVYNAESDAFTPVTPVPTPAPAPTETKADAKTEAAIATAAAVHGVAPSQIQPAQKQKKNNTKTIIIICVCALLVIGVAVAGLIWFLNSDNNKPSSGKNNKDNNVVDLTESTTEANSETTTNTTTEEPTTEEPTTEPVEELDSALFGVWQTVQEEEVEVADSETIVLKTYVAIRFKEDGTYDMVINQEATVQAYLKAFYDYFSEKGVTKEKFDAEFEAENGMSFEAAIRAQVATRAENENRSGTWRTKLGTLILVMPNGNEVEDVYSVTEKKKFVFNGFTYDFVMNLDGTIPE